MRINPSGLVIAIAIPIAGYCFGGQVGLGIGCIIVILINALPNRR